MSYDIQIGAKVEGYKHDGGIRVIAEPYEHASPTYNLGTMFRACTGWDYEQGEWYKCSDVIDNIERGIRELSVNRAEYEQYNPPNGWGSIDSARAALCAMRDCIYETAEDIPLDCLYVRW